MSKSSDVVLTDGNMPQELKVTSQEKKELYDEDDEDTAIDSWEDMVMMKIGPYNIEFDPNTRELTITGQMVMEVDCLHDGSLQEIVHCKTVIFHH